MKNIKKAKHIKHRNERTSSVSARGTEHTFSGGRQRGRTAAACRRGLPWLLCLACLLVTVTFSACSDAVLNPDGTIHRPGDATGPLWLEGQSEPVSDGEAAVTLAGPSTELPETSEPPISLGDSDPYAQAEHRMYVDFLSTGASDCILLRLIEGASQTVLLVDTGEANDYDTICQHLEAQKITAIDYLILTHYDNDHIGSAARLLASYPVGHVYMPDYVRDSKNYRALSQALEAPECTAEVHRLYAQDVQLDLGYGQVWINATAMEKYAPGQILGSDQENGSLQENNFSLITSITFGHVRLLLTGDAEQARMAEFLPLCTARGYSAYDLIKIPHHGRSGDKALLAALRTLLPRYCVTCTDQAESVSSALSTCMVSIGAGRYFTYDGLITCATDGVSMTMMQK